ncbi:glutamate-1-semialdehyde 2,1-aminomutase [Phaeocystidibacter luteus]|uniref:Glutamate-1-semialdehyde 2,1-aminomutase n=1 Tax=Phaeocystidibacter luteus TaxID=911197 RepID=A0A6N6RD96_9FLAO|nr:glutamate-1-semialdehyde 2,1-aminomutase [Phaeocystidibacter luteus]KAB2807061.1 glutamate-1-semialdehyde 2,1-aminomutase [Phaeocystidibacter luteus]
MLQPQERKNSEQLFERAGKHIPGGVNSPVRAFKSVGGNPIFFSRAEGAYVFDEDDNRYIDFINSWGPMILGHGFPEVVEAVQMQAARAMSFGAPTELEIQLAETICEMTGIDMVRLVNSGTEACMSAIRLARGYTGRDKIIKFEGCYHGHGDSFLIKAGSGASTLGVPNSPGVTKGTATDTLTAPFNDLAAVEKLISENPDQIAAIITEPVAGNMGCVPPAEGYMEGLRALCDKHGIVFIMDEVMTGFRLAPGGAQERLGVEADLVCYGKVIGGGMPVGAFGGKREIFQHIAPTGPVYQAGTLSGNPLAVISGLTTLRYLQNHPEVYAHIDHMTERIEDGMREILENSKLPFTINRLGSMISIHFCENEVMDYTTASEGNNNYFKQFFHGMLNEGIYLPPSAYETWFVGNTIGESELEHTLYAAERVIEEMSAQVK